jgi:hypothetical protein
MAAVPLSSEGRSREDTKVEMQRRLRKLARVMIMVHGKVVEQTGLQVVVAAAGVSKVKWHFRAVFVCLADLRELP